MIANMGGSVSNAELEAFKLISLELKGCRVPTELILETSTIVDI